MTMMETFSLLEGGASKPDAVDRFKTEQDLAKDPNAGKISAFQITVRFALFGLNKERNLLTSEGMGSLQERLADFANGKKRVQ